MGTYTSKYTGEEIDKILTSVRDDTRYDEYVKEGLSVHFSGRDNYNNGAWVDRASGCKLIPVNASVPPVYDTFNKFYHEQTGQNGMISDFSYPAGDNFTFEIVTRDIVNNTNPKIATHYAILFASGGAIPDGTIAIIRSGDSYGGRTAIRVQGDAAENWTYLDEIGVAESNSLDTFAIVPNVGYYHNGVKVKDCNASLVSSKFGLFTALDGDTSFRSTGKIHSIRMYKRQLTEAELLQNYNEDVRIYGE